MPVKGPGSASGPQRRKPRVKPKPKYKVKAPKAQPGPVSAKERRKVEQYKGTPQYKRDYQAAAEKGVQQRKKAREKRERDKDTKVSVGFPVGPRLKINVESIAEGTAKPLSDAGRWVADNTVIPLQQGSVAGSTSAAARGKKAKGTAFVKPKRGTLPYNLIRNAVDTAAQAPSSLYLTAAAGKEAATGDTGRARELVKSFKETSAIPPLVKGDLKEAGRRAHERPVTTALEVSGAKALVGRTGGAVARHAPVGAVRKAGSVERAPQKVQGREAVERKYSRDIITKGGQVAVEKAKRRKGRDPQELGESFIAPRKRVERHLERRADEEVYTAEGLRRASRTKATRETRAALPPETRRQELGRKVIRKAPKVIRKRIRRSDIPRGQRAAVPLAVARIVRKPETAVADLTKYRAMISDTKGMSHAERRQNTALRKQIDSLLSDPEFVKNPRPTFEAAKRFTTEQTKRDVESNRLGLVADEELGAKNIPYAVVHKGVRFDEKARKVPAQVEFERLRGLERKVAARMRRATSDEQRGKIARQFTEVREARKAAYVKKGERKAREFRDPEGNVVKAAEVEQELKNLGTEAGFFTQRPNARGAQNYFVPSMRGGTRVKVSAKRRTGEATRRGTFDASPEVLVEQAARSEGYNQAARNFDNNIRLFAQKKPVTDKAGKVTGERWYDDWDDASTAADEITRHPDTGELKPGQVDLVPVRIAPLRQTNEKLSRIQDNISDAAVTPEKALEGISEGLKQAFEQEGGRGGEVALIPRVVRDRLLEHDFKHTSAERALQRFTNTWKEVVLSGSTKWLTGNVVDITGRSLMYGLTPLDWVRGHQIMRTLKRLDPEAAERVRQMTLGGSYYSAVERSTMHRPTKIGQTKIGHGVGALWRGYKGLVFGAEKLLETEPQYAALGKLAQRDVKRNLNSLGGFFKVGEQALDDWAKGLQGTPRQVRANQYIEEIYGRWGKLSPSGRRFLIQYAPFAQWLRVASKFVFLTLPAKHPIKTGILAAASDATEQERLALGLSLFLPMAATPYPQARKPGERLPDWLQGSLPTSKGNIRFSGYTSFGVTSEFPSSLGDIVLPQFQSGIRALGGEDWRGEKLREDTGERGPRGGIKWRELNADERLGVAFNILLEGQVPFLSHARRLREKGGTTQPKSRAWSPKTKPGSEKGFGEALDKMFNPLRPIPPFEPTKKKVKVKAKDSGWGSGSGWGGGSGGWGTGSGW